MAKRQTVPKGKHFTRLWQRFWWPVKTKDVIERNIYLYGAGLRYDIGSDQKDWNKLAGGMYFDPFRPHGRTIMIGWRYNPDTNALELTPYYHNIKNTEGYKAVGSVPGYVNEANILSIPMDTLEANIRITMTSFDSIEGKKISLYVEDCDLGTYITDTVYFDRIGSYHSISNLYVGGNRPAQDYIHANIYEQ